MIELPGNVRVLRYRLEEIHKMLPPIEKREANVDYFTDVIYREYSDWYVYDILRNDAAECVFVILTERPVPVLSEVVKNEETGEYEIEETVYWSQ